MTTRNFIFIAILSSTLLLAGCGNQEQKLKAAAAAENTGDQRTAAKLYADLAIEAAPAFKLPDAQQGKIIQPSIWLGEMVKYIKWLTEPAPQRGGVLISALNGLERSVQHFEQDNVASQPSVKTLDSLPAFAGQWNQAFNPPPPGTVDWHGLTKQAMEKKFSILRLSSPTSYIYDISVISRKTSRRVSFTLYPESKMHVPLAPAEYSVIVKSSVEFQKGQQRWVSEKSVFSVSVTDTVSLITVNLKTRVARK